MEELRSDAQSVFRRYRMLLCSTSFYARSRRFGFVAIVLGGEFGVIVGLGIRWNAGIVALGGRCDVVIGMAVGVHSE